MCGTKKLIENRFFYKIFFICVRRYKKMIEEKKIYKPDIFCLDLNELEKIILEMGEKKFRASQIFDWIHKKNVNCFDEMKNIPVDMRNRLKNIFEFECINIKKKIFCDDGTIKFLFELKDKNLIEGALMKYSYGNTICISSQVGCRMNCKFCASGIDGLKRNLSAGEILQQVYLANKISRVSNIVLMGSGEPLDNFDNVIKFISLINHEKGLNISQRNIVLSSCGLVEKIYLLAEKNLKINLAISLHAPNDFLRKKIMPSANKYLIKDIISACEFYFYKTKRRITFEYILIKNLNDREEHARELVSLLKDFSCHVNLILFNKTRKNNFEPSDLKDKIRFKKILEENKINVTVRRKLGNKINAACGQLKNSFADNKD